MPVDGTAKPAAWDSVVQEINGKLPTGARR
jgi:hypothetical protein